MSVAASKPNGQVPAAAGRLAELERQLAELGAKLEAEKGRSVLLQNAAARQERHRIAQALHDSVCQSLTGISLETAVFCKELAEAESAVDGKALRDMVRQAVRELQEVMQGLRLAD